MDSDLLCEVRGELCPISPRGVRGAKPPCQYTCYRMEIPYDHVKPTNPPRVSLVNTQSFDPTYEIVMCGMPTQDGCSMCSIHRCGITSCQKPRQMSRFATHKFCHDHTCHHTEGYWGDKCTEEIVAGGKYCHSHSGKYSRKIKEKEQKELDVISKENQNYCCCGAFIGNKEHIFCGRHKCKYPSCKKAMLGEDVQFGDVIFDSPYCRKHYMLDQVCDYNYGFNLDSLNIFDVIDPSGFNQEDTKVKIMLHMRQVARGAELPLNPSGDIPSP